MKHRAAFGMTLVALCVAWSAQAEDLFFDSDGVKIRYVVEGEGQPLILIHGFTANFETNWKMPGVASKMAEDYQVIGIDCRGHGKSEKPHEADAYGAQMSKDVINLMDHLKIDKAHVAGYSMGGMITLHLINTYPERFASAIVGGMGWSEEPLGGADFPERLAQALENGDGLGPLLDVLTPPGEDAPSDEEVKMISSMILATNDAKALAAVARGFTGLSLTKEQIAKNTVPTIGIVGGIDPLKVQAESMKEHMSNVLELVILPGADHMTAFGHPGMVKAMKAFLDKQSKKEGSDSKREKNAA